MVRSVGNSHAAHFLVPFSYGLFPVPPENANSESAPLFFSVPERGA